MRITRCVLALERGCDETHPPAAPRFVLLDRIPRVIGYDRLPPWSTATPIAGLNESMPGLVGAVMFNEGNERIVRRETGRMTQNFRGGPLERSIGNRRLRQGALLLFSKPRPA